MSQTRTLAPLAVVIALVIGACSDQSNAASRPAGPQEPAKPAETPAAKEAPKPGTQDPPKEGAAKPEPAKPAAALLDPAKATETAPETFKVKFDTTKGAIVIEVTRAWAPNGADRFYNLVKNGFYDECRFFRIVPGFIAQIGMNGDPAVQRVWQNANIKDDAVKQSNQRGFVTFAQTQAPNSRSTQLFINFKDNSFLDGQRFAPFGKVLEGLEVAEKLYTGYGERPNQMFISQRGNEYLSKEFPQLDYVKSATIVK